MKGRRENVANISYTANMVHQRDGFSQYNHVFEFQYNLHDRPCHMVVTSVTGHLMNVDVEPRYRTWSSCDPIALFDLPVIKSVSEVVYPYLRFSRFSFPQVHLPPSPLHSPLPHNSRAQSFPIIQKNEPIGKTLKREAAQCQELVLWLDCDREGENIAFEV